MYQEKIFNVETGEEIFRDYTDAEIAEVEKAQAKTQAEAEAEATKAADKAAVLAKLGLNEDEARLLVG